MVVFCINCLLGGELRNGTYNIDDDENNFNSFHLTVFITKEIYRNKFPVAHCDISSQVLSPIEANSNDGNSVVAIRGYDKLCHDINATGGNIGIVGQLLSPVLTKDISYSIEFVEVF